MSEQIPILEHPDGFSITWIHPCALHGEDEGWYRTDEDDYPSCDDCGCMLEVEFCIWCGASWLSYGDNEWDDTIRSASTTPYGDIVCARCARAYEDEEIDKETMYDDGDDF